MGYIASFSGGKDSTAMVLRLIEDKRPLDKVVFFDTQMEFKSVYQIVDKVEELCKTNGIEFIRLRADENVWLTMLARPVKDHYGYEWCGGQADGELLVKHAISLRYYQKTIRNMLV